VKNFNPISQDVGKEKAAKERKNEGHYKMVCAAAGMDFASFITTVWGGFSKSAELVLKMLVSRLVVQEDVTNSWASTTVRRRIQVSFMKQIALNGLTTMRKIKRKATLKRKVTLQFLEGHFKTEGWLAISARTKQNGMIGIGKIEKQTP